MFNIVIFVAPGSDKGTQFEKIVGVGTSDEVFSRINSVFEQFI